jgi:hypothetical protein
MGPMLAPASKTFNEVAIATLIGLRHWSTKASVIGGADVPDHTLLPAFDARLGAEPRRLSLAIGSTRTVPVEGRGIARGGNLVLR